MKQKRSEGVRRLFLLLSILLTLLWVCVFQEVVPGSLYPEDAMLFLAGGVIAFLIPQLIRLAGYWVLDGFRKDRITG